MRKNRLARLLILLLVALLVGGFFAFDLQRYLTLGYLKESRDAFAHFYAGHRWLTLGAYLGIYILVTALSLPGATVMTLAGGALFGFWTGVLVVSFASSIGATLAFLVARFLLHDLVQQRFAGKLGAINDGIRREGAFYLFSLRLVPLFPFFLINLAMGLTPIGTWTFYWVSQLGMLAGTAVYVNAGTQLGRLNSLAGILSPELLLSFVLLGLFPLLAKKLLEALKGRRALAGFARPRCFGYNLVVVGAGSAGLVSAYIAASARAKVALIEKEQMGGDCLNTGCVPSKALLRAAKLLADARRAEEFGLLPMAPGCDFAAVMERVQRVIDRVAPHDSVERYSALGVECLQGEARIVSPYAVQVGERTLTTRSIILATGAEPVVPPIPGLDTVGYLTSDTLWQLRTLPERLVVLGGGPIGCEMAQAFVRFGSAVTQVEMAPQLLGREDAEVGGFLAERFAAEGIRVLTGHTAREIRRERGETCLVCAREQEEVIVPFDAILVAVGRRPRTAGLGLEALGVRLDPRGTLPADPFLRTSVPTILCAGDVAGPYQFTHTAAHQAWYATINALFGSFKKFRADYRVIPWSTFTDPEVARVGLSEAEARGAKIPFEVTRYDLAELDRAIVEGEEAGWVKVLSPPGKDRILGVTIVAPHAGDLLAEFVLAMKHGLGLGKILGTVHPYPTLAEAGKAAAGAWKRDHLPQWALPWLERYHNWRRGC